MDEFRTTAKIWPDGTELDLGTDSNLLGGSATFTRNASNFVTSPDGTHNYQFLFWNTGRHMTNKRQVRWNFSVLGWGTWTATRWYGTPPPSGTPGPPRVRADAFTIGGDAPLSGATPIDGAASTYPAGAWPYNGDNHAVGTAGGAVSVVAKDLFDDYQFAGWMKLIWGGDPIGEFVESDAGTGGVIGGPGFYDHVTGPFPAAQNASADLLATYGTFVNPTLPNWGRIWQQLVPNQPVPNIPLVGDPSPIDFLRLSLLEQLLLRTQPAQSGGTDFQSLIRTVPTMSHEELTRAMQSVKTTLELGKTALSTMEAQLKRTK